MESVSDKMSRKKKPSKATQKPASKSEIENAPNNIQDSANLSGNFGVDEVSKLLRVFPEEIWLLVLGKLRNTEDVTAIFHTSLYFRNLLLPLRVSFLFPHVWKVLGIKYELEDENDDEDAVYEEGREDSRLRKRRTPNGEVLKFRLHSVALDLRQVCRDWCNGIDQFYQNLDSTLQLDQGSVKTLWSCSGVELAPRRIWEKCYAFFTREHIHYFRNHFDQTHLGENKRSPFWTNEICIRVNDSKEYTMQLKRLLEDYNQHIWHCNMIIKRGTRTLSQVYLEMRSVLELLPNLVGLRIWFEGSASGKINQKILLENPLPTLKKLVYLKCEKLPTDWFDHLITRNLHIKILEIGKGQTVGTDNWTTENPNLSELFIDIRSNLEFEKLRDLAWKPEKISLSFAKCPYIPWSKIFQFVETKWGQTVTDMMIGLPSSKTRAEIMQHILEHHSLKLNLPKVKRLRIELGNVSGIDFILPMKDTLKQLDVVEPAFLIQVYNNFVINKLWNSTKFRQIVKQNIVIKFLNQEPDDADDDDEKLNAIEPSVRKMPMLTEEGERVYDDNVWKVLPKLDILKLFARRFKETPTFNSSDTYTRLEWLKLQENKI